MWSREWSLARPLPTHIEVDYASRFHVDVVFTFTGGVGTRVREFGPAWPGFHFPIPCVSTPEQTAVEVAQVAALKGAGIIERRW